MAKVVKRVVGLPHRFGGEEHTGWLPPGAAKPPPTPVHDVLLDLEIQEVSGGYLLVYHSQDDKFHSDTWHDSLVQAVAAAEEWFRILAEDWESLPIRPEPAA